MLTAFCPKCHSENHIEEEICCYCGTKLNEEIGDYVDRLINFSLKHPVPSIPPMAAEILGKIGDKRALEPLLEVLKSSDDVALQESAVEALGRLKDERAVLGIRRFMKRGALGARRKAIQALREIGGSEALAVLKEIAESDKSVNIREEATHAVQELASGKEKGANGGVFFEVSEAHKRGIAVTLSVLDEALCETEEWTKGREIQSVFYKEQNTLSRKQREEILRQLATMRQTLQEIQETLKLESSVQDVANAIRSRCAGLWEHIVELKGKHLRRYGRVPAGLTEYLDPRAERLIQGILGILEILKQRGNDENGGIQQDESDNNR